MFSGQSCGLPGSVAQRHCDGATKRRRGEVTNYELPITNYKLQITNYEQERGDEVGGTQKANERRSDGGAEARKGNAESRNAENVRHEDNRQ